MLSHGLPYIILPINFKIPVSDRLIKLIPDFVNRILLFSKHFDQATSNFVEEYKRSESEERIIKGYLFTLCFHTAEYLFDSKDVRVRFRYLRDGFYKKIVSTLGDEVYSDDLSPIGCDKGMIYQAGVCKKSLIKSLNL